MNDYISIMELDRGSMEFPIWLLGDSEPQNWAGKLRYPLDPRHPSIHNIWTPILNNIQRLLFQSNRSRLDESQFYVRNAVKNPADKPMKSNKDWTDKTEKPLNKYRNLIFIHKPILLISFGSFSYEFLRRAIGEKIKYPFNYWTTKKLGCEFRENIGKFELDKLNIIPLLHATIARKHFLTSHNYFCDSTNEPNYFDYTSKLLGEIILNNFQNRKIWL